ncbi:MAG: pyrroline-5-carboxylate reductase [Phycisphaerales bacterium]|nr:pyrroline-5-carboxylate reductase [Phycisphaerales bacterium]MCB9864835.1 pyrroline-5-carboxylate reductase [Phycisphaerales bacterium]
MSEHQFALGVIGSGHIAGIIVRRLINSGYLAGNRIVMTESRNLKAHPLPVTTTADAGEVLRNARIVILSVTPQKFADVAASLRPGASPDPIYLSVMAGVETRRIAESLGGDGIRVVRAMPNLPFSLGRGVTGLVRGQHATADDVEEARHLFNAGGVTVVLEDENLMDAVTAVAGSGPAYFYYFVEMMMEGGVAAGLKPADAQVLAAHACVGAGAMLLEQDASPRELREAVTSPGGTTQAAMDKLSDSKVAEHVRDAVLAAFERGRQLGRMAGQP